MSAFHIWKDDPPPRDTLVMARYRLASMDEKWQLVRTCKRGCCVFPEPNDGMGSQILPKYWREFVPDQSPPQHDSSKEKP